jgi:AraC family transcriptional regulator of adaptative response / DNA-3-methyladenine glycosylase II
MTTFSAVVTTGIYCRPGCGARPLLTNCRTYELAAAAEADGFRACLRCRPYRLASPIGAESPELVCRAWQMIIDGVLDEGTEAELAERVGLSARHLRRLFVKYVGASPDQLARSRRAHFARRLLDDTDLTILDVAFASGFGSLRQFNRSMQEVFRDSPSDLRRRRHRADRLVTDGGLALRLPVEPGYDWDAVRGFLAVRAAPGVEAVDGDTYRRTVGVEGAPGVLEIAPGGPGWLLLRAHLPYWEGLIHVVDQAGRLVGADADPSAGVRALAADPVLGPLVKARPGLVVPGAWNPFETGVQAILSRGGRSRETVRGWLAAIMTGLGTPVPGLPGGLTHMFPEAAAVTADALAAIGLPDRDASMITGLAAAVVAGHPALRPGTSVAALADMPWASPDPDPDAAQPEADPAWAEANPAQPEAGPAWADPDPTWAEVDLRHAVAFRLGAREAFPRADASLSAALADLGIDRQGAPPGEWPWPALAAVHLMVHGDGLR